jgi:hypothetical protein
MDGLSIITGIGITVLLLLYLAFNLEQTKEMVALKLLTVFAALGLLLFIPATTINLQNDCGILSNGTYLCFNSTGGQITPEATNVGINFYEAYTWYIIIFFAYLVVYASYRLFKWIIDKRITG